MSSFWFPQNNIMCKISLRLRKYERRMRNPEETITELYTQALTVDPWFIRYLLL